MSINSRASERVALIAQIAPISSNTTSNSGWVSVAEFDRILAKISVGVLGSSATVAAKLQQGIGSGGSSPKDITNKAITGFSQSPTDQSGSQEQIDCRGDELDVNNGYDHVQLSITVGTAASLVQGDLWGFDPKSTPTSALDLATMLGTAD